MQNPKRKNKRLTLIKGFRVSLLYLLPHVVLIMNQESHHIMCTLTDPDFSCPRSLLKTTPPPPGYPWVSVDQYVTPKPRFSSLVLNHQGLALKNHKTLLNQIWLFLSVFFLALVLLKLDGRAPKSWF